MKALAHICSWNLTSPGLQTMTVESSALTTEVSYYQNQNFSCEPWMYFTALLQNHRALEICRDTNIQIMVKVICRGL